MKTNVTEKGSSGIKKNRVERMTGGSRTEVLSAISLVVLQYSVHRYLMSLPTPFLNLHKIFAHFFSGITANLSRGRYKTVSIVKSVLRFLREWSIQQVSMNRCILLLTRKTG
jgi:hypothetical protein